MSARWWYARRGVAWQSLLGCCAAAVGVCLLTEVWPRTASVLLPALLACCAAASAFVFDEPAVRVVEVTPRGATWRRTTRLGVGALPLTVWVAAVGVRPGGLALERPGWWLAGAGGIALTAGAAGVASRHQVATPGVTLAAGAALGALAPLVVAAFLGVGSPYPPADLPAGALAFWAVVGVAGVGACVAALRPGLPLRHTG